jgi:phage terminase large subunit-like protein
MNRAQTLQEIAFKEDKLRRKYEQALDDLKERKDELERQEVERELRRIELGFDKMPQVDLVEVSNRTDDYREIEMAPEDLAEIGYRPDVCRKIQQHRARLKRLLERGDIVYDAEAANRAALFIESYIKHWKEPFAGKPFVLSEWQREEIVKPIFGYKWKATGLRVFREVYIQLARKNGKSSLIAAILLLILFMDGRGLEIYCAATKEDQAKLIFNDCSEFVRSSSALKKRCQVYTKHITCRVNSSILKILSADQNSLDGLNVSAASIDELHAHPTARVHDVIMTATGTRSQPLVLKVTTAGDNLQGVCFKQYEYAEDILEGRIDDPAYFAYIAEPDIEDDWKSPEAYRKANPNLGISVREDYIQRELAKAIAQPSYVPVYRKYTLDQWMQTSGVAWLDYERWKKCAARYDEEDLRGCPAWLGVDMSKTTDLTAVAAVVELREERYSRAGDRLAPGLYLLVKCFLPAERIELTDRREADYKQWVEDGWINVCGTSSIDDDDVSEQIAEWHGLFEVREVGVDRNRAGSVIKRIEAAHGREVIEVDQSMKGISETAKSLERAIADVTLRHNDNPCLNWQVQHVKVRVNGDMIKPIKGHDQTSGKRIDAIYATVDALFARSNGEHEESVYETRGMVCL